MIEALRSHAILFAVDVYPPGGGGGGVSGSGLVMCGPETQRVIVVSAQDLFTSDLLL